MMDFNIMNPCQTATNAAYTIFFWVAYYVIWGILRLYSVRQIKKTVDASLPNAKMQFCSNSFTLSEGKISTSTSSLETAILFHLVSLTVASSIMAWSHTFVESDHENVSRY